jgi:hypothetical protein
MTRTTLDLDNSVLTALKRRQKRERKSLGQVASELLARALADSDPPTEVTPLAWVAKPMRPRVDLEDREAVQRMLDSGG